MKCKLGDVVILHKSNAGNEGAVGTVVEFLGEFPFYAGYFWSVGDGPCWLVCWSNPLAHRESASERLTFAPAPDAWLTPLPGALADETESTNTPIPAEVA